MKTLKYFIFFVMAVITITSCHKEKVINADYRDQWMGEYAYISDRDGGMEGKIYADKTEDNYVNIYINGIGELLKMKVEEDGSLSLIQQDYYWHHDFTGHFTEDSLVFEYYVQSDYYTVPPVKVSYKGHKINSNTFTNRDYPVDYRDKWMGRYLDNSPGSNNTQIQVRKVSYNRMGITESSYPWDIIFEVEGDGSLTLIKPGSDWGNYRNFEGAFTDGILEYSFEILTPGSVINRHFTFEKAI